MVLLDDTFGYVTDDGVRYVTTAVLFVIAWFLLQIRSGAHWPRYFDVTEKRQFSFMANLVH